MFLNKCSAESFDQRTHYEFLITWSGKSSLHTSNNSPELVTKLQMPAFNCELFLFNLFLSFLLFFFFRYWLLNQDLGILHK